MTGETFKQFVTKRSNPYYMFSVDQTEACIYVYEILYEKQNYCSWENAMIVSFDSRNFFWLCQCQTQAPDLPLWWTRSVGHLQICNALVLSWIYNSIDLEISGILISTSSALVAWSVIANRYRKGNISRLFKLKQQLYFKRKFRSYNFF